MQKWLPDEFASDGAVITANLPEDDGVFEQDHQESRGFDQENQRLFLSESGFSGPGTMMSHLTGEERAQVFDLVEQDIQREYEVREQEYRTKIDEDFNKVRKDFDDALGAFSENLHQAVSIHMKDTADATARLAVQLAEKIIRKKIDTDPEVVVRALETTLYKIDETKNLTISVNPEQAQWFENHPDVREKFGISQIVSDRRIEAGGCIVRSKKQEWDATIKGQLNYLGELVDEMLKIGNAPDLSGKADADEVSSLD